jgi:hypothetical protein
MGFLLHLLCDFYLQSRRAPDRVHVGFSNDDQDHGRHIHPQGALDEARRILPDRHLENTEGTWSFTIKDADGVWTTVNARCEYPGAEAWRSRPPPEYWHIEVKTTTRGL